MNDKIIIKGAREHNLKNISLELPRNKLIVFTGLSGSGKSSLAFDTIFAEGQRRYIESLSAYARQFLGQMDKPDVDEISGLSPAISIDQKAHSANPRSTVATITEIYDYLRVLFARVGKPFCPVCNKSIKKMTVDEMVDLVVARTKALHNNESKNPDPRPSTPNPRDSITIYAPVVRGRKGEYYQMLYDLYNAGFAEVRVDGKNYSLRERIVLSRYKAHTIELLVDRVPLGWPLEGNVGFRNRLAEALESALERANGTVITQLENGEELTLSSRFSCADDGFAFPEIEPRLFSFNSPYGACPTCHGLGTESLFSEKLCIDCGGNRLRRESLCVRVGDKSIVEVTALGIENAAKFFGALVLNEREATVAAPILTEIISRLRFLLNVGLHYLTLDRQAGTLSGGEAQRIRLASQVGSGLVGALYVLDEPTIGLHQRDNERLIATLKHLRDLGNTIIVVEHDHDTILSSDYLVDIGPGAGTRGGEVVAADTTEKLLAAPQKKLLDKSLTLQYLCGLKKIPLPAKRRGASREILKIKGASANNLKNINVEIPLRRFVAITGVSGSGKSTLVEEIIYRAASNALMGTRYNIGKHKAVLGLEYLDKVIEIDQSPIGRTPRSNPATYTGAWTHIRDLFTATEEARLRGYKPGRFSFNVPGGRCEHCEGNGSITVEMHFLPAVTVPCEICRGRRFDRETLDVTYRGKNIYDVLTMTMEEADKFFRDIPWIHDKLKVLLEVGLGYLELGQSATTLSGGEAQRVKLAAELSRRGTGRTLYILDEPTTGLHYDDIRQLLAVLERLVAAGNSVIVIEHNLDVIKMADHIIDLGPEGGDKGGELVVSGTPEEVARSGRRYTSAYLRGVLN